MDRGDLLAALISHKESDTTEATWHAIYNIPLYIQPICI